MDILELQKKVIEFRDARDWAQYHNSKDLAISPSLEASELHVIFQWKGTGDVEAIKSDPKARRRVQEELGDVLIHTLNMCHAFGFDPSDVILKKLEMNEKKYPVERSKNSAEKCSKY
jgi:dCTP diphosphatase